MPPTPFVPVVAPAGRRRFGRARSRLVAALGAAAAVLVLPAALAGVGGSLLDAGVGSSCASAAGTIHVGLVIDYGTVDSAGSSRSTSRQCVALPDSGKSRSGANALMAGNHALRWSSSGLLCAIDGYPATGCGESSATGYRYWSYWHGGDSWSYSSVGPDSFTPKDGAVEGWHFIDGTGTTDGTVTTDGGRKPRSSATSPCPASPGSTTPPTTSATTPPPTPVGSGSGSGGSAVPTSSIVGESSTTLGGDPTLANSATVGASADDSAGSGSGGTAGTTSDEAALGANAPVSSNPSGSHLPIGAILMVVAVLGLAGSAFVRFRTRPAP